MFKYLFLISFTASAQIIPLNSGTEASFRSISAVSKKTVYVGGSESTLLKSTNHGKTFTKLNVTTNKTLDFRGLATPSKRNVLAMSAGLGENKKAVIFRSKNNGKTFEEVYRNNNPGVFLDAMHFANKKIGYVIGDAIDEYPFVLKTTNGGKTWNRISPKNFPKINKGEASYAASNSCIYSLKTGQVWFHTQNRVFKSTNYGQTWTVSETQFTKGESSGIFGIKFRDQNNGIIVGGDYIKDKEIYGNYALTNDGGLTWSDLKFAKKDGLKEGIGFMDNNTIILSGTSGLSYSLNKGKTFQELSSQKLHAISCSHGTCYLSGSKGKVILIKMDDLTF